MSLEEFFRGDFGGAPTNLPGLVLSVLLAFAGGHLLAWVYMLTHSGLSYSRSFVKSLTIMPVVVALVMGVMVNSLVTAFGMMAILAIVRFRNMLRDTLDTTFVLVALMLGMACGSEKFATAIFGVVAVSLAMLYLWVSGFGTRHHYDLILNLHWGRSPAELAELERLLTRHARRCHRASQRASEDDPGMDISYWLLLRDVARIQEMLTDVRGFSGVTRLTSIQANAETEV